MTTQTSPRRFSETTFLGAVGANAIGTNANGPYTEIGRLVVLLDWARPEHGPVALVQDVGSYLYRLIEVENSVFSPFIAAYRAYQGDQPAGDVITVGTFPNRAAALAALQAAAEARHPIPAQEA